MSWLDQNLPHPGKTGWTLSNLSQFMNLLSGTWSALSMLEYEARKAVFCYYRRAFWNRLDRLSVAAFLIFFSQAEKKNNNNISGTKQLCERDVCFVWFRRCLRKDFLSLVLWLWWETSQRPVPFFYFYFFPLSFLVVIQCFYLFWY